MHYAYGVFLLGRAAGAGHRGVQARAARCRRSTSAPRSRSPSRYIKRGEFAEAKPWARAGGRTRRRPSSSPATRSARCCSRPATSTGAVRELEAGVKLAADSPAMHFALARAYRARRPHRRRRPGAGRVHAPRSPDPRAADRRPTRSAASPPTQRPTVTHSIGPDVPRCFARLLAPRPCSSRAGTTPAPRHSRRRPRARTEARRDARSPPSSSTWSSATGTATRSPV